MPNSETSPPSAPHESSETPTETASDASASSTTEPQLPAVVDEGPTDVAVLPPDGFSETIPFKALDLRINRMKGEFWLDGDPQPRDVVYIISRGCHKAQQFFGLPYNPKDPHEPSCYSPDGQHGYGWIDVNDQVDAPRKCMGCPKKGFGGSSCTDLMTMLAYDRDRKTPIMLRFQNAELNPRKGVLTLAVNRFRSMGLAPVEALLKLSFAQTDQAYQALVIDVAPVEGNTDMTPDEYKEVVQMLDTCWAAYEESRGYEIQEIMQ